jgi:hypothetical protein
METMAQCLSLDIFHDKQDLVLFVNDVVDGGYMLIREARCSLGFLLESPPVQRVRPQRRRQPFQGYASFQAAIFGAVHFPHSAFTESFTDGKASDSPAAEGS